MSTPPVVDPLNPDPVPQPVLTVEWFKATVTGGITAVATVAIAMGWWNPTKEQLIAIGGLGTWLVLTIFPLVAYFVHNRVTPTATANKAIAVALATPVPDPLEEANAAFMAERMQKRADADAALSAQAS